MDLEQAKENVKQELALEGYKPGELQWEFRQGFYNEKLAELAIVDALVNIGGIVAWRGDGVSCVAQMLRPKLSEIKRCTRKQPHEGPCNGWPCPYVRKLRKEI